MDGADKNVMQEIFARVLKKLGEMGDFFTVAAELSKPGVAAHNRLFSWLLTKPEHAGLKEKYGDEDFFRLISQLADLDVEHQKAGHPADSKPSAQVKRLLADDSDLAAAVRFLDANAGAARFLADENAQRVVSQLANNGLYRLTEKLAADSALSLRLADDSTPFFATLQVMAAHPEMDGLLAAVLRQLANDDEVHKLPDDEEFARLVVDLADSHAVNDPVRREQFIDLVRGFSAEAESLEMGRKILFTARFPQVASRLSQDEELTNVVRSMLDDEHHKKVAEMLKAGGDSAQVILSVAEDTEFAETIKRMCEDKAHPDGFNELVKKLCSHDDHFFEQIKRVSEDELFEEIHSTQPESPLTAEKLALRLNQLGKKLYNDQEYERAITNFKMAQMLDPTLRDAYLGHAQSCVAKGFYTMAVEDYATLFYKNSHDTAAHLGRGNVNISLALYDDAEADFHKVLDLSIDENERQQADDGLKQIQMRKKP
jgi:tetratricopeptide (TPR) repeat protein